MTQRIIHFLPSICSLATICLLGRLYFKLISKKFSDRFKNIEWCEANQGKIAHLIGMPVTYVIAPAFEELLCRAPIIVIFSWVSPAAWEAITASSVFFAAMHWPDSSEIFSALFKWRKKRGVPIGDEVQKKESRPLWKKILQVIITFPMGLAFGYYGIRYQSIWISFGLHAAWNLVGPFALTIVLGLVMLFFELGKALVENFRDTLRPVR
jgi:membrane protease YdiL (CAAX protease family)